MGERDPEVAWRAKIHKVVDDWLEDPCARDLLLRHDLGDDQTEVIKDGPPHTLEVTSTKDDAPPMPHGGALLPLPARRGGDAACVFDALVPEELRPRKTGLNVALIADFNIAGRMTGLMRLLNRHSIHRARCIVVQDDYLSYDRDVVLSVADESALKVAMSIVEDADVYHFGRMPPSIFGIDWLERINPRNALVQYFGSEIRHFGRDIVDFHDRTGIVGLSAWDYTMLQPHPLFYHVNNFFDAAPEVACDHEDEPVRICHATTNRAFKQSSAIWTAMRRAAEQTGAEAVVIEGKSHRECLEEKRKCHVTVDQVSSGIYGLSAIESMAMGHAVLCGMGNFALSYYPDCPVVPVSNAEDVEKRLVELVVEKKKRRELGRRGRNFALRTANPIDVLRQHCWIYDLVVHGHRFAGDPDEHMLRSSHRWKEAP